MQFTRILAFCFIVLMLASCGKKSAAPPGTATALDTTQPAKPVPILDTNHHLFFRPPVGSVKRYHVLDKMTMSSIDTPPGGKTVSHTSTSNTEFFIRQTVKAIGRDSSVTLAFRVDSVRLSSQQDTSHLQYSSNDLHDRMDDQFREFNIILGKDFTIRVNKHGDLDSMVDVSQIATALLAPLPDSTRNKPNIHQLANQQAGELASAYVMRVLVHNPIKALITDTTWRDTSNVNLQVAPGLSFPVHVVASETVQGLEQQAGRVFAVLVDNTTTTPTKRIFQEGPTTATIQNLIATSHSVVHIEDTTGLLYLRTMQEKRNFTMEVENKSQPGQKRTITQNGAESLTTEVLE